MYRIAEKESGGAYILFSKKDENNLFVLDIDNDGKVVNTIDLKSNGVPYHIIANYYGFIYMAR